MCWDQSEEVSELGWGVPTASLTTVSEEVVGSRKLRAGRAGRHHTGVSPRCSRWGRGCRRRVRGRTESLTQGGLGMSREGAVPVAVAGQGDWVGRCWVGVKPAWDWSTLVSGTCRWKTFQEESLQLEILDCYKQGIPCSDRGVSRRPYHVAALNTYCFLAFKIIIMIVIITIIILGCFKELRYNLHTVECAFVKCIVLSFDESIQIMSPQLRYRTFNHPRVPLCPTVVSPSPAPSPRRPPICNCSSSLPFHDCCVGGTTAFGVWLPLVGVKNLPPSPVATVMIASVMNSWKPTQYIVKGTRLGVRGLGCKSPFPAACNHLLTLGKAGPQFPVQETWFWVGVLGGSLANSQIL